MCLYISSELLILARIVRPNLAVFFSSLLFEVYNNCVVVGYMFKIERRHFLIRFHPGLPRYSASECLHETLRIPSYLPVLRQILTWKLAVPRNYASRVNLLQIKRAGVLHDQPRFITAVLNSTAEKRTAGRQPTDLTNVQSCYHKHNPFRSPEVISCHVVLT